MLKHVSLPGVAQSKGPENWFGYGVLPVGDCIDGAVSLAENLVSVRADLECKSRPSAKKLGLGRRLQSDGHGREFLPFPLCWVAPDASSCAHILSSGRSLGRKTFR